MPSRPPQALVEEFVQRPLEQRLREHRYRCAQSLVFGLPVIALQYFGLRLGGPESQRWVAMFQAALSGWVTYVAATGMISEGIVVLLAQRRVTKNLFVGLVALGLEAFSFISATHVLVNGQIWYRPLLFHVVVMLLIAWSAIQWATSAFMLKTFMRFSKQQQKL